MISDFFEILTFGNIHNTRAATFDLSLAITVNIVRDFLPF